MRNHALLLICWACANRARRLQASMGKSPSAEDMHDSIKRDDLGNFDSRESAHAQGTPQSLKVLARLLRRLNPAAAFNHYNLGGNSHLRKIAHTLSRADVLDTRSCLHHLETGMSPPLHASIARTRTKAPQMGVPKFFRWITNRLPEINRHIYQGRPEDAYVDNFYLDMNGIIHGCTHGSTYMEALQKGRQLTKEDMVELIFEYTERLIRIAAPRKICYLAIDGVAPRAKMNQQRSRRYRAPAERAREAELINKLRAIEGKAQVKASDFDSNCITPGTEFLADLGERYKKWIEEKMATDPEWMNGATIIFSGSDVIGEGEHKIMDFIRRGQQSGEFDKATRHCMYGLDADLIMLSLVTHAPKFCLLRERQKFQSGKYAPKRFMQEGNRSETRLTSTQRADAEEFVWLEVELLRELMALSLLPLKTRYGKIDRSKAAPYGDADKKTYDHERVIDDFVFMCMLVGNDFLPGLPNAEIGDGALDFFLPIYTNMLPTHGYLTDKCKINLEAFEHFLEQLAADEVKHFAEKRLSGSKFGAKRERVVLGAYSDEEDYKYEYYLNKFGLHPADKESKRAVVQSYLEALHWCLAYYHDGCGSWDWFYPDFYAPCATDLKDLPSFDINLKLGRPFPPLAQLLSVLPPESATLVPPAYQELMLSQTSPIYDAFPKDFSLDLNGKDQEWEAIALLPFIDEKRLLKATDDLELSLTEAERARNVIGQDLYYTPQGTNKNYMPAKLAEEKWLQGAVPPESAQTSAVQKTKASTKTTKKQATTSKAQTSAAKKSPARAPKKAATKKAATKKATKVS